MFERLYIIIVQILEIPVPFLIFALQMEKDLYFNK